MDDDNSYNHIAALYKNSKLLGFRKHIEAYTLFCLLKKDHHPLDGKSILDLACGEGFYTRAMKQHGAKRVLGIDLSEEMIKLAKYEEIQNNIGCQYITTNVIGLGKIVVVVGEDEEEENEEEELFDIVTACYLLNYAQNKEMLKEMCITAYQNLKSGGIFIGINDNPFNDIKFYGQYSSYGFIKESPSCTKNCSSSRVEGSPVKYIMTNQDGSTFHINNFYLSPQTYQEVFEEVGFIDFQWEGPYLSHDEKDNSYWNMFMEQPPIIGFSSRKI